MMAEQMDVSVGTPNQHQTEEPSQEPMELSTSSYGNPEVVTAQPVGTRAPPSVHTPQHQQQSQDLYTTNNQSNPSADADTEQDIYRDPNNLDSIQVQRPPAAAAVKTFTSAPDDNPAADQRKNHQTSRATPHTRPSAPPDVALVHVEVDWPEELPEKWRIHLEKALQTWCNSEAKDKGSVEIVRLLNNGRTAAVKITPSSAIKDIKTATLEFKKLDKSANVRFLIVQQTSERKPYDLTSENSTTSNVEDVEAPSNLPPGAEKKEACAPLTVPPFLYCYLTQVYKQEVQNIEKKFGVKINVEACVSISDENQKKDSDSVRRATEAFTELYQNSTKTLKGVSIPSTDMESNLMKEMLCYISKQENKLWLNISANEWRVFGPQNSTLMIDHRLSSDGGAGVTPSPPLIHNTSNSYGESTSESLHIVLKDAASRIQMDEAHWKLLRSAFKEKFFEIQEKFGVEFQHEPGQGSMTVSARAKNANQVNLEVHALHALTHLYQKVVTSTLSCDLTDASNNKTSQQKIQQVLAQHPDVQGEQRNGHWRLSGLQKHLVPANAEIEKVLGRPAWDGAHSIDWKAEPTGFHQKFPDKAEANDKNKESEETCPICLDSFTQKEKLICGHEFCAECLRQSIQSIGKHCPICKKIFGILTGNQPDGKISIFRFPSSLPGYPGCGTIEIQYRIPSGIQTSAHPNPGQHYKGTSRTAFLPDNQEGNHVLALLRRSWDQRLTFTVGYSRTTGYDNTVVWNDIHHKTSTDGGPQNFGYPDPDYLKRVKEELKSKGIE